MLYANVAAEKLLGFSRADKDAALWDGDNGGQLAAAAAADYEPGSGGNNGESTAVVSGERKHFYIQQQQLRYDTMIWYKVLLNRSTRSFFYKNQVVFLKYPQILISIVLKVVLKSFATICFIKHK